MVVNLQSYKGSCKNIDYKRFDGGTLSANCDDNNGGFPFATIKDIDNCKGQISNEGGNFLCTLGSG